MSNPKPPESYPATWMRGGTSKGLFFHESDLPCDRALRDSMLLAAIGSPDPYGGQIDGMGCATSSTSKVVIIGPPPDASHDLSYLFGHVDIRRPLIDWSGSCGNLAAAVGLFALEQIRCLGAVAMGLARDAERVHLERPATPKIAFVAPPRDARTRDGAMVPARDADLLARILSMGRLHHAFTGTGSVAAAVAAAIPGTLVQGCLPAALHPERLLRLSHPAGVLEVGAQVQQREGNWIALRATLPRTARTLMQGRVFV